MAFSSLVFNVRRREPELIAPDKPTPCELKYLSDIDYRVGLRRHYHIHTLVYYYPFAGRLGEVPGGKLLVECTGQVVLSIDDDVTLNQLGGDFIKPPIPCSEQLLYTPSNSEDILSCPLLFVQVTRLMGRGFIVGFRHNHTICDAQGLHQFVKALAEIARGQLSPSTLPVWERHLRNGPKELAALRQHVPPHLQACSTFELLTAWLGRCRTIAIGYDPREEVRVVIAVNTHSPLPTGFYGNAVAYHVAVLYNRKVDSKSF